jgi:hypothetical protein
MSEEPLDHSDVVARDDDDIVGHVDPNLAYLALARQQDAAFVSPVVEAACDGDGVLQSRADAIALFPAVAHFAVREDGPVAVDLDGDLGVAQIAVREARGQLATEGIEREALGTDRADQGKLDLAVCRDAVAAAEFFLTEDLDANLVADTELVGGLRRALIGGRLEQWRRGLGTARD